MANFEDHYGRKDASNQQEEDARYIRQYNTWVQLINQLTIQMIEQAKTHPPEHCDWVYENGEKKVSWNLKVYTDYDGGLKINLMPDGRLVFVGSGEDVSYIHDHVRGEINLREISRREDERERDISRLALSNLFDGIVSSGLGMLGMPTDDLHGATSQHWGRSWSNYH